MNLDLAVVLDPKARHLRVHAVLSGAREFLLNEHLTLTGCRSAGATLSWHEEPAPAPFDGFARRVVLDRDLPTEVGSTAEEGLGSETEPAPIELDYSGTLPPAMMEGVNVIGPEVVELSVYSAWFPVPPDLQPFDWRMALPLPTHWQCVTNGKKGCTPGEWRCIPGAPVGDIVVVASPTMQRRSMAPRCELVCTGEVDARTRVRTDMAADALELLGQWYGPPETKTDHTLVVTHRDGFAYSRMPVILLPSASGATAELDQQTLFHELSHFWWNLAPVKSHDDWLNESLAEYSSMRLVRALINPGAGDQALERYRQCAATSRDDPPMRATDFGSEDGTYANKYARGAIFHEWCALRLGRDTHDAALRGLFARHVHGPQMSTQDLLDAIAGVDARVAEEAAHVVTTPAWDGTWPDGRPGVGDVGLGRNLA